MCSRWCTRTYDGEWVVWPGNNARLRLRRWRPTGVSTAGAWGVDLADLSLLLVSWYLYPGGYWALMPGSQTPAVVLDAPAS